MTAKTKRVVLVNPDPRQFIYLIFVNMFHGSQDIWHRAWNRAHRVVNKYLLAKRYTIDKKKLKPLSPMMNPQRPARMIRLRSCFFGETSYLMDADRSTLSSDSIVRL